MRAYAYHWHRGGAAAKEAELQPNLYSPLALWGLLAQPTAPFALEGADRSGNLRNLSVPPGIAIDDLIPGRLSGFCSNDPAVGWDLGSVPTQAFVLAECTVTARIRIPPYLLGGSRALLSIGGGSGANERISLDWNIYAAPGDGVLRSYWQRADGSGVDFVSPLFPTDGHWHFVSYRRTAAHVVTLGMDGVYATSGPLDAPGTANTPRLTVGYQNGTSARKWLGQVVDMGFWPRRLTDLELVPLNAAAMAL